MHLFCWQPAFSFCKGLHAIICMNLSLLLLMPHQRSGNACVRLHYWFCIHDYIRVCQNLEMSTLVLTITDAKEAFVHLTATRYQAIILAHSKVWVAYFVLCNRFSELLI